MKKMNKEKIISILRYIAILPGAIIGAWIAYFGIITLNKIVMSHFIYPDSFLAKLYLETMGNLCLGAAFVYVAQKISPSYKKRITFIATIFMAAFMGLCLFPALMNKHLWAIYCCIVATVGAASYYWYDNYISKENEDI
jgi:lysylphosphatidylglycerol synthetase-like protein (DUF2156 family)